MDVQTQNDDIQLDKIVYRQGAADDMRAVQSVFLHAAFDLLYRSKIIDINTPPDAVIDSNWEKHKTLYQYLNDHAEQYWLAELDGKLVGFARSLCEDHLRELTEFYVMPPLQAHGVGHELLKRAYPTDANTINCVIATRDIAAHALYIKSGSHSRFLIYEMSRAPEKLPHPPKLDVSPLSYNDESLEQLVAIDKAVLGHRREHQHRWLLSNRSGYLYRVDGDIIGYGYVGKESGPFALYDPKWFPDILSHAETEIATRGYGQFLICVPTSNTTAINYCLERKFQIDPFLNYFFSSKDFGQFDRYINTNPSILL